MKKQLDKEKLFMTVLIVTLCVIFVVLFTFGLNNVLAMEGSYPPNVLTEGITPAPDSKEAALELLNGVVNSAVDEGIAKLDTADNFEVDTDTLEISGSAELKTAMLYVVDSFDSQLDSNFNGVSTEFGEDIKDKINIPSITADDIIDFNCDYIYYSCPSCGENSDEQYENCEKCGGVNPYNKKYRDEYTVTLTVAENDKNLDGDFNRRTPEEALALCGDTLTQTANIQNLSIAYDELKIVFKVERLSNRLTYLDYSKTMSVSADAEFTGKYASLGKIKTSFKISENNSYSLTWPKISLSAHEITVEPGGTNNLLATLTCTDPLKATVKWESSDENIVTVDDEGYFDAGKTAGEAKIKVSFEFGGKTYTDECVVKVCYSVESSKMNKKNLNLVVGETAQLKVTISPAKATVQTVKWYSENENIATVDENGVVTAKQAGTVVVYSLTDDGYFKSSCEVTVK